MGGAKGSRSAVGPSYKVVVIGASGTGKTALMRRLTDGIFDESVTPTIGVDFRAWNTRVDGPGGQKDILRMNIWDTAGQERFRSVSKAYFRNSVGAVITFAINDGASFREADAWMTDIRQIAHPGVVVLLVGTKADLDAERQVTVAEAREYALRQHSEYMETSALRGDGVREAFVRLGRTIMDRIQRGELNAPDANPSANARQAEAATPVPATSSACC